MFDIGWLELIVIGIVALIVVGPKDLPQMFRTVGRFMGKMRAMAREFQRSMEEAADQSGLKEATSDLKKMSEMGLKSPTKAARGYAKDFLSDAEEAASDFAAAAKAAKDEIEAPAAEPAKTDAAEAPAEPPKEPSES